MNSLNVDIDSLVLRLGMSVTPARAEGIVNDAIGMLEELLRNHSFDYLASVTGFRVDLLNVPSISIREGALDIEISKSIAYEIYRALIKGGSL